MAGKTGARFVVKNWADEEHIVEPISVYVPCQQSGESKVFCVDYISTMRAYIRADSLDEAVDKANYVDWDDDGNAVQTVGEFEVNEVETTDGWTMADTAPGDAEDDIDVPR